MKPVLLALCIVAGGCVSHHPYTCLYYPEEYDVSEHLQLLQTGTDAQRANAMVRLEFGSTQAAAALQPLTACLEDDNWRIRMEAVRALGRLRDDRAIEPLMARLQPETGLSTYQLEREKEGREASYHVWASSEQGMLDGRMRLETKEEAVLVYSGTVAELIANISRKYDINVVQKQTTSLMRRRQVELVYRDGSFWFGYMGGEEYTLAPTAKIAGPLPLIAGLYNRLKWENPQVMGRAIVALGSFSDRRSFDALQELLPRDESCSFLQGLQPVLMEALGRSGEASAVPILVDRLRTGNARIRESCARGLGYLNTEESVDALLRSLKDNDHNVVGAAVDALGRLESPRSIPYLLPLLDHAELSIRRRAMGALGRLRAEEAVDPLLRKLQRDPPLVPQVILHHAQRDRWAYPHAVRALGEIGNARAVKPILRTARTKPYWQESAAIVALGKLPDGGQLGYFLDRLESRRAELRRASAEALGHFGNPQAIPYLIDMLKDSDIQVRANAAAALGNFQGSGVHAALRKLVADHRESSYVRQNAIRSLGKSGDTNAFNIMIEYLHDDLFRLQFAAIEGLGYLGDPAAIDHLAPLLSSSRWALRLRTIEALKNIPDLQALDNIRQLRHDPNRRVRQAAAEALGEERVHNLGYVQ